ncbi:SDR family oxidoreductase [Myroides odoratimimus]|uniref:dTDP-4-dehydrorhamnose reductase family protein n=1 Tax=Myroides odoratimimus TaxID=76832 RepID=UPI0025789D58|nr:SDR family oxidoreductase [Myroides odoratimimus]MDM1398172.1 SDR family oxidoreductase [Myroides odoratimimus]MEC4054527.1 SDR family oxidoreductase [Myroides odoratimimus]
MGEVNKKKLLVIGIKGMAGHVLYNYFSKISDYDVFGLARGVVETKNIFNLDVIDVSKLRELISKHRFDIVVNCIGILNKDAEDNPSKAIWFNSYFPHFLEEITKDSKTKVIHISTDCVFSGKDLGGNYTEVSFKNGEGFYAQSKALGELNNNKDVTIRTSIIGPEINSKGIGLFHWFMSQSDELTLKGFSKAYWSGITTFELAKVIDEIIKQNIVGLIQVAATSKIDKYTLLQLFNKIYKKGIINIEKNDSYVIDKSLKSIRKDFQYEVPSYDLMLEEQLQWIYDNEELYKHYM